MSNLAIIEKEAKELIENIREYYKKYRKIPDDITLNKIIDFLIKKIDFRIMIGERL